MSIDIVMSNYIQCEVTKRRYINILTKTGVFKVEQEMQTVKPLSGKNTTTNI